MKKYLCTEPTNFGCMAKTVIGFIINAEEAEHIFLALISIL